MKVRRDAQGCITLPDGVKVIDCRDTEAMAKLIMSMVDFGRSSKYGTGLYYRENEDSQYKVGGEKVVRELYISILFSVELSHIHTKIKENRIVGHIMDKAIWLIGGQIEGEA
jgi:hypothetical protein